LKQSTKNLSRDIAALAKAGAVNKKVFSPSTTKTRPLSPAQVGVGTAQVTSSGSSIASPLTETSRVEEQVTVTDPFGLWAIDKALVTQVKMNDASGEEVEFNYTPQA
jgi:hypothetical protein